MIFVDFTDGSEAVLIHQPSGSLPPSLYFNIAGNQSLVTVGYSTQVYL